MWIEILPLPGIWHRLESQPARAVWIEIFAAPGFDDSGVVSQPARAVWIEIGREGREISYIVVTACEGCVD